MLSFMPPLADQIVAETSLLSWLLKRVAKKEYDSNKQYASEILAILLQQSRENVVKLDEYEGMETLLQILAVRMIVVHLVVSALLALSMLMYISDIARRILATAKKWSSWRISLIASAPPLLNRK